MTLPNPTTKAPPANNSTPALDTHPTLTHLLRELDDRWPPTGERIHEISRHALLPAGKMLRPLLLVESAGAVGGDRRKVVPAALGVEYLHVGSLIHDDVIDGDTLRRGRPTVAARYGTADAIVTGDALIMGMFAAVAECADHGLPPARLLDAVRVLARAGTDLCRGQVMEAELCGDPACGMGPYRTMIALKTGSLFRGACHGGAILGGGSPAQQQALVGFAEHLGLAFQMHDDLLPYTSDAESTGKSGLSDVANGRPTAPILVAHRTAGPAGRRQLEAALGGDLPAERALGVVRDLLESTGAVRSVREQARAEALRAKEFLAELPPTESSAVLAAVADLSIDRKR